MNSCSKIMTNYEICSGFFNFLDFFKIYNTQSSKKNPAILRWTAVPTGY